MQSSRIPQVLNSKGVRKEFGYGLTLGKELYVNKKWPHVSSELFSGGWESIAHHENYLEELSSF